VATETQHALAVLSGVLDRNGQQLSASQARQQALADADHLAILHAIWTDQTTQAREQHYRDLLAAHLPPGHRREPGHQARWLWRTLRAAELAGLDPGDVLAAAISERDLAGARDLAAVIDARIRYRTGALVPTPAGPWSSQVPAITDAARHAYLTKVAALMDARQDRTATRQHELAASYQALHEAYRQRETVFAATLADRADWDAATRAQRHLAVAADAELRRRHPGQHHPPLRSAEPEPATETRRPGLTTTAAQPPARWASGSGTWPPRTARSPTGKA
jgi:hypothetical protein